MQTWLHVLDWRATSQADELAIDDGRVALTYRQLYDLVQERAGGWSAAGVRAHDVVAVLSRNSTEFIVQTLSLMHIGALPLLLNWRMTGYEVERLLAVGDPVAVVVDQACRDLVPEGFAGMRFIDASGVDGWRCVEELSGTAVQRSVDRLRSGQPAILMHTSGTTGDPKLIPLDHSSLIRTLSGFALDIEDQVRGSRHLILMPMFHLAGLAQALQCFLTGGMLFVRDGFDVRQVLADIAEKQINFFTAAPTIIEMLTIALESDEVDADVSSLIEVQYGAAPIAPELLQRALVRVCSRFRQIYGSTELQGFASILRPVDHVPGSDTLATAGQIALGWEARVVGADGEVAPGQVGELQLRSDFLIDGYWNNPAETAAAFTDDGWYRTGDLATLDDRKYLRIVGRTKDMIISGGENVYPAEIERALYEHAGVAEAAVVGRPDPKWGERPVAFVVLEESARLGVEELRAHCALRLAGFKRPEEIILVDMLPRNALGKVLKTELRDRVAELNDRT